MYNSIYYCFGSTIVGLSRLSEDELPERDDLLYGKSHDRMISYSNDVSVSKIKLVRKYEEDIVDLIDNLDEQIEQTNNIMSNITKNLEDFSTILVKEELA